MAHISLRAFTILLQLFGWVTVTVSLEDSREKFHYVMSDDRRRYKDMIGSLQIVDIESKTMIKKADNGRLYAEVVIHNISDSKSPAMRKRSRRDIRSSNGVPDEDELDELFGLKPRNTDQFVSGRIRTGVDAVVNNDYRGNYRTLDDAEVLRARRNPSGSGTGEIGDTSSRDIRESNQNQSAVDSSLNQTASAVKGPTVGADGQVEVPGLFGRRPNPTAGLEFAHKTGIETDGDLLQKLWQQLSHSDFQHMQKFSDNIDDVRWEEPMIAADGCVIQKLTAKRFAFNPSCNADGTYTSKQCFLERCWCVDRKGKPVDPVFETRFSYKKEGVHLNCPDIEDAVVHNDPIKVAHPNIPGMPESKSNSLAADGALNSEDETGATKAFSEENTSSKATADKDITTESTADKDITPESTADKITAANTFDTKNTATGAQSSKANDFAAENTAAEATAVKEFSAKSATAKDFIDEVAADKAIAAADSFVGETEVKTAAAKTIATDATKDKTYLADVLSDKASAAKYSAKTAIVGDAATARDFGSDAISAKSAVEDTNDEDADKVDEADETAAAFGAKSTAADASAAKVSASKTAAAKTNDVDATAAKTSSTDASAAKTSSADASAAKTSAADAMEADIATQDKTSAADATAAKASAADASAAKTSAADATEAKTSAADIATQGKTSAADATAAKTSAADANAAKASAADANAAKTSADDATAAKTSAADATAAKTSAADATAAKTSAADATVAKTSAADATADKSSVAKATEDITGVVKANEAKEADEAKAIYAVSNAAASVVGANDLKANDIASEIADTVKANDATVNDKSDLVLAKKALLKAEAAASMNEETLEGSNVVDKAANAEETNVDDAIDAQSIVARSAGRDPSVDDYFSDDAIFTDDISDSTASDDFASDAFSAFDFTKAELAAENFANDVFVEDDDILTNI